MTPEAAALIARINTRIEHFAGSQHVPDSKRHRIPRPPLTGAPEPLNQLLADIRAYLESHQ